ncbi:MAG: DUF4252 domain-containing protein [Bacteroidales bacterium]|nr:DUF4252 domain-containing protein [Bacteroidales bacterium]
MVYRINSIKKEFGLIFLVITAVLLILNSSCQNNRGKAARDIFEKYEGDAGIYIFRIPPGLVNLLLDKSDETDLVELLAEMEMIKVIICDKSSGSEKRDIILEDFNQKLSEENFEDLLMINNSDHSVQFKIHEGKTENIDEIMMLMKEEDSFLGLSIVGNLTYDQISMLTNKVKIDDFRNIVD